jgi:hypothetical protein
MRNDRSALVLLGVIRLKVDRIQVKCRTLRLAGFGFPVQPRRLFAIEHRQGRIGLRAAGAIGVKLI